MKGTEKQIAWAAEIRENVLKIFDDTMNVLQAMPDNPYKERNMADLRVRRELVANAEYAGDVINLFKDVRHTGDNRRDWPSLLSVYRIHAPVTDGERKILAK